MSHTPKFSLILILLLFLPLKNMANAADVEIDPRTHEEFLHSYLRFVEYFADKNWSEVESFVHKETICSFGDAGIGCIETLYKDNEKCWQEALQVLRLGCKILGTRVTDNRYICKAPYDQKDELVLRNNMNLAFSYSPNNSEFQVERFMCGGD